jgi:acyl dehydratase
VTQAGARRPTRLHDQVAVGEVLPELVVPLTRTLIVAGAIASRDYQDVHHDPELARARGSEDVFMNILTTNGLVGRYVTDWAGPAAVLERVAIRLGAPNYPGDTMTLSGTVTDKARADGRDDGRASVTVAVRGRNSRGDHVTGTVRLALPVGGRALRPLPGPVPGPPAGRREARIGP